MEDVENTIIKEILEHLSDGERKTIFSIHEKYRLSPSEVFLALEVLTSDGAVTVAPPWVQLVENYDDAVCKRVKRYYFSDRLDLSFEGDGVSLEDRLQINEPYLPEIKYLDEDFFD